MKRNSSSKWKIQITYSNNKNLKLEVKPWGIQVTLPIGTRIEEAYRIIEKHKTWIQKKQTELLEALEYSRRINLVDRSMAEFRGLVEKLVEQATLMVLGMNPCKIVIRKMRTRWASCSPKGTLTINSLARYLPDDLLSYIIYHEICHVIEPRHNKAFWTCVQKYFPKPIEKEKELIAYEIRLGLNQLREPESKDHKPTDSSNQ